MAGLRASLRSRRIDSAFSLEIPVRGLLIEAPAAHLPEHTFALHLPLQDAKRLLEVIVSNKNLHACCSHGSSAQIVEATRSRCQARKSIQGTRPVETKRVREQILSSRKDPHFARSESHL
jgi:hypothetical protein